MIRLRALMLLVTLAVPAGARAQERVRDLELSAGLSVEGYRGNLTAATISALRVLNWPPSRGPHAHLEGWASRAAHSLSTRGHPIPWTARAGSTGGDP